MMAKKSKNSPTPEQIDFFFKQISYHQVRLNLQDWRIENSGSFAGRGNLADVSIFAEDKLAVVSIGDDWGAMPINERTLTGTAIHELLHVFFRNLMVAALSNNPSAISSAEHSVIVVLEKLLSPQ